MVSPVHGIMPQSGRKSTYPSCSDGPSQLWHRQDRCHGSSDTRHGPNNGPKVEGMKQFNDLLHKKSPYDARLRFHIFCNIVNPLIVHSGLCPRR
jgi:hypothetical protein